MTTILVIISSSILDHFFIVQCIIHPHFYSKLNQVGNKLTIEIHFIDDIHCLSYVQLLFLVKTNLSFFFKQRISIKRYKNSTATMFITDFWNNLFFIAIKTRLSKIWKIIFGFFTQFYVINTMIRNRVFKKNKYNIQL